MFNKILIANRGEIACRVIRTARRLGIQTVAVYSEADRRSLHVRLADEAVCIGPPSPRESYLNIPRILEACKTTGAQAVHPGYGFLSENPAFARALRDAGIVFLGPPPEAIEALGDKISSKLIAARAGVNTIPGSTEVITDPAHAARVAAQIGFPVMLKASAGGGGKGLRIAWNEAEAAEAFSSCTTEAQNAFGDGRVFIEKYIVEPRHIEIQILADSHGQALYLWERECSLQRRHQKLIEEAPSPFLDEETRHAMGRQAVQLALAVGYQSAGTVEFVVGADKSFYFLEMNTRLQVEHPVTEFITGLDLVEQMLRVAAGLPLPCSQEDLPRNGWAVECRINAEDPFRGFLPSVGRLHRYLPPEEIPGQVRVDTGVYEGGEISIHYDSMIAKLIAHGPDRQTALDRLSSALDAFHIRGVASNLAFQSALIRHPRFVSGHFHTGFLAEEYPNGVTRESIAHPDPAFLAAVAALARRRYIHRAVQISNQTHGLERRVGDDWVVLFDNLSFPVHLSLVEGGYLAEVNGQSYQILTPWRFASPVMHGTVNGVPFSLQIERHALRFHLLHLGKAVEATVMTPRAAELLARMKPKPKPDTSKFLLAPMPGLLSQLLVAPNQAIKAGERLAVIEAMKMENVLRADHDVTVAEVLAQPGDTLSVDQPILRFS